MSNNHSNNNSLSARDASKLKHDQRQQMTLIRREEQLIQVERDRLQKGLLSKDEIQDLRAREEMLARQRRIIQLDDEMAFKQGFSIQQSNDGGYIDTARQEALLKQREDTINEYRSGLKDDSSWQNEQLNNILSLNAVQPLTKPLNKDMFNKINLMMHQNSSIKGEDSKSQLEDEQSLLDLNEEERQKVLEKRQEALELSKLSEFEQIQYKRRKLPAYQYRDALLTKVRENQVLIIEGETGSGKTTQIMQYLYEDGYCIDDKMVACTQPRRVAATSVAARVAVEKGVKLGEEVGYNVRFDNCTSDKTRIKYLTDGMLLRELLTDPNLSKYSVIMIDEAHERTISTDILLGILKPLLKKRPELKLLIASATINIQKFSIFFSHAPTFKIPGRTCNIDIYYAQTPEPDYIEAAIITIMQIHTSQPLNGDILVFLPGQEEIQQTNDILLEKYETELKRDPNLGTLLICPIYANLPAEEQAKIFYPTPQNMRKVVLATNIAETSLTIDGIVYVIDCGWCKTKLANSTGNAGIGMEALITTPISKASANQRAGRAGRIRDGKCFRLFTYDTYLELDDQNIPEIQRSNLCNVILLLKGLGINRFVDFDWIDPPSVQALNQSISLLYALGAIAPDGKLTKVGYKMTILPVDPMVAKMLIKSELYQCTHDCIKIAALLSLGGSILYQPNQKNMNLVQQAATAHHIYYHELGDHFTLLNIYNEYLIQIAQQNQLQKEFEESLALAPSTQKQRELAKVKKHVQSWCQENFLQFKMLQRAQDIVLQLNKVCTDIDMKVIEYEKQHIMKLNQFIQNPDDLQKDIYIKDYEKRLRLSILHGFFPNIAKFAGSSKSGGGSTKSNSAPQSTAYILLKNQSQHVYVHPHSCLYRPSAKELKEKQRREQNANGIDKENQYQISATELQRNSPPPSYILFHELMQTKKEYLRGCMVIEPEWIGVVAPHFYPEEARALLQLQQQQHQTKKK